MTIKEITQHLETIAPAAYQESYDNAGLIVGNPSQKVTGILVCLDSIEAVIDEAIALGCNLIVAHHPIVFRGLKKLTGKNYVERVIIKAIKNDIAIFAIHTNLDSVYHKGVNGEIANRIGLKNTKILAPKKQLLMKITSFVPVDHTDTVLNALYLAGAGQIGNYKNCSFSTAGTGSFIPTEGANPSLGKIGAKESVKENRIEVIFPAHQENAILNALKLAHPYEEVAYYTQQVENEHQEVGGGLIGELETSVEINAFMQELKQKMKVSTIRHTDYHTKQIKKVAVCGGAGSFLLPQAIAAGADIYISADFKYHEFFDADGKIIIADIGHYESEQFTTDLLFGILKIKFENIPSFMTKIATNPVKYL
jgi:dinuclear metal center YbgI/SA1388 family protein